MSCVSDAVESDKYRMINFEETKLRLGLPGAGAGSGRGNIDGEAARKRGFSETVVDLKLNISSKDLAKNEEVDDQQMMIMKEKISAIPASNDPAKPPSKYVHI